MGNDNPYTTSTENFHQNYIKMLQRELEKGADLATFVMDSITTPEPRKKPVPIMDFMEGRA